MQGLPHPPLAARKLNPRRTGDQEKPRYLCDRGMATEGRGSQSQMHLQKR